LANLLLSVEKIALANKNELLVVHEEIRKAQSLIQNIFPKYFSVREGFPFTLWPDDVYRTLYTI